MTALLDVDGLDATPGGVAAVVDAGLTVASGEVVALLGANGAGKTSLLRALMGLAPATARRLDLDGADLRTASPEARARAGIGWCPEGRRVFPGLSAAETLDAAGPPDRAERRRRAAAALALFPDLVPHRDRPAWQLSGGQQQMLAIARAAMTGTRLLLLDEPLQGLAPQVATVVAAAIRRAAAAGAGVLVADPSPARALAIADRGLLLQSGRIVRTGSAATLAADPTLPSLLVGG